MGRRHRFAGLVRLAIGRVVGRFRRGDARQVLVSVLGVAVAIALVVTVGGVAVGLASQSAIQGEDIDYWVVPEGSTASTVAVSAGGPQLGGTHAVTERLAATDGVEYATPVLLRVVSVRAPASNASEYLLAAGVIPGDDAQRVLGVPTGDLAPGDPHFAGGDYDGPWTGELVASDAAATLLDLEAGETVTLPRQRTNRTFRVANVTAGDYGTGAGPLPVVVVHLSELQAVTGATSGDPADQILVSTDSPDVRPTIERIYPQTTVVQKSGISGQQLSTSSLPLAVSLTAVLAAVVVGTLFVATMMGLELHAARRELAVLAAIGYRTRSRALVVVVETFAMTFLGAALGTGLGVAGIALTNRVGARVFGVDSVAVFDPVLVGAAAVVATLIAALASVYPVWLTRRTDVLEVLG
jgi:putative ABC transport system permease protein